MAGVNLEGKEMSDKKRDDHDNKPSGSSDDGLGPLDKDSIETIKNEAVHRVGYCRPPMETQFKKGQSGNPKGRPRNAHKVDTAFNLTDLDKLVLAEAARIINVLEGQKTSQMSVMAALIKAQVATGLKGSPHALKYSLDRIEKSVAAQAKHIAMLNERFRAYQEATWAIFAKAEKNGLPAPDILPHPDDIEYRDGKEPIVNGPCNAQEARSVEDACKLRDQLLLQSELDEREEIRLVGKENFKGQGSARYLAEAINTTLPKRLQYNEADVFWLGCELTKIRKRDLLKEVYQGWRELGYRSVRRGYIFPPLKPVQQIIEIMFEFVKAGLNGEFDLEAVSCGQTDYRMRVFADRLDEVCKIWR